MGVVAAAQGDLLLPPHSRKPMLGENHDLRVGPGGGFFSGCSCAHTASPSSL